MTTPHPHCETCTCNLIDAACARAAAAAASATTPPYYPGSHARTPVPDRPTTTRTPATTPDIGDGLFDSSEGYRDGTYSGGEDGHDGTYDVGEGFDDE